MRETTLKRVLISGVCLFLTAATTALGGPLEDLRAKIDTYPFESLRAIETSGETPTSDREGLLRSAFLLIQSQRIQEAIWVLDGLGETTLAQSLEARLQNFLQRGSIVKKELIRTGFHKPMKLTYLNGLKAIFKEDLRNSSSKNAVNFRDSNTTWTGDSKIDLQHELWASLIDRTLHLGLVPLTTKYSLDGAPGIVQVFVENAPHYGISFRDEGYSREKPKIYLLDFLIFNTDRHAHNLLRTENGSFIAIDNGETFDFTGLNERQFKSGVESLRNFSPVFSMSSLKNNMRLKSRLTEDLPDLVSKLEHECDPATCFFPMDSKTADILLSRAEEAASHIGWHIQDREKSPPEKISDAVCGWLLDFKFRLTSR